MDCLEMDVVISKDGQVVVAHEPYMPANICLRPDGSAITESEEKSLNLYQMDYADIQQYTCGLKHPRFEEQQSLEVYRPLLSELIEMADGYCESENHSPVNYTIEIKSQPDQDDLYHPAPAEYIAAVLAVIEQYDIADRVVLQAFDYRMLVEIHKRAPHIAISMLIADPFDLEKELACLGFTPPIIGPAFGLLDHHLVETCHAAGMRVVPWTVNEVADMERLISMGVDGIITDYPDRKSQVRG